MNLERTRFVLLYAAGWVPFVLVYSILLSLHAGLPAFEAAASSLWNIVPAAILGVGAWYAGGRIEWREHGWRLRFFAAHGLLAMTYAVCWTLWTLGSLHLFTTDAVVRSYLGNALGWQLLTGAMLYAVLAGIARAVRVSRRLRAQKAAAARNEALRARAELEALRAQLNPHFLFNVLHSISALVREDPSAIEVAVERLARLIRYAADLGRTQHDDVAVADELRFVEDYLALEQLRFGDRLEVVRQVDPQTLDCGLPPLTLQPLVENAVCHGIAPLARGGTVNLRAQFEEDRLVLEVKDDGRGTDVTTALSASGLGLRAVRQRLAARFEDAAHFEVDSSPGRGFRATVKLPIYASPTDLRG